MNRAWQVKIVCVGGGGVGGGGKLHSSSGCPPDKLSSLAYF